MEEHDKVETHSSSNKQDLTTKIARRLSYPIKIFSISIIFAILLIPLGLVAYIITDREHYRDIAVETISTSWGSSQRVIGPILIVPVKYTEKNEKGKSVTYSTYADFAPNILRIDGKIIPEIRHKGIFQQTVYTANINLSGNFSNLNFNKVLSSETKSPVWKDAFIVLGVADTKGIIDNPTISFNGKNHNFLPEINDSRAVDQGIHALTPISDYKSGKPLDFNIKINLRGTYNFNFLPIGKDNIVKLYSTWSDPSFVGSFLPNKKTITDKGFEALWHISYLASNISQEWNDSNITNNAAYNGVELLITVDTYRNALRSVKYGILFILFTFLVCFIFEILTKSKIHPIQYLLVGMPLALFYLLLLSLSEFIPFWQAYLIASIAIITVITVYFHTVLNRAGLVKFTLGLLATLIALFSFLYVLLVLEDLSLLAGSIGLLIGLIVVMFITRNIDWYEGENTTP